MINTIIVDDELSARRGIEHILVGHFPEINVAGVAKDGLEALSMMEKTAPHLVISDISMPVMDGIELSKAVRIRYPSAVMIVLTAYDDFTYAQTCLRNQVFEYVLKPIDEAQLVLVVTKALAEVQNRRQTAQNTELLDLYSGGGISRLYEIVLTQRFANMVSRGDMAALQNSIREVFEGVLSRTADVSMRKLMVCEIYAIAASALKAKLLAIPDGLDALDLSDEATLDGMQEKFFAQMAAISSANERGRVRSQKVRLIKRFIMSNYREDISLKMLADEFNMNPTYLSELFKEETGQNFRSFLIEVRIEHAIELMKDRKWRIQEVAAMVGYPDSTYFNKAFKRVTGMTPSDFRQTLLSPEDHM